MFFFIKAAGPDAVWYQTRVKWGRQGSDPHRNYQRCGEYSLIGFGWCGLLKAQLFNFFKSDHFHAKNYKYSVFRSDSFLRQHWDHHGKRNFFFHLNKNDRDPTHLLYRRENPNHTAAFKWKISSQNIMQQFRLIKMCWENKIMIRKEPPTVMSNISLNLLYNVLMGLNYLLLPLILPLIWIWKYLWVSSVCKLFLFRSWH